MRFNDLVLSSKEQAALNILLSHRDQWIRPVEFPDGPHGASYASLVRKGMAYRRFGSNKIPHAVYFRIAGDGALTKAEKLIAEITQAAEKLPIDIDLSPVVSALRELDTLRAERGADALEKATCQASQLAPPWQHGALANWDIVCLRHYTERGERRLSVTLAKDDRVIKEEGRDSHDIWLSLIEKANGRGA